MSTEQSTVTIKFQATIPKKARSVLKVRPGESVRWHTVRGRVFVDVKKSMKHSATFLTGQTQVPLDAIKLIRSVRNELV